MVRGLAMIRSCRDDRIEKIEKSPLLAEDARNGAPGSRLLFDCARAGSYAAYTMLFRLDLVVQVF
jgi:hypothetical protein